jgi:hypothetical protein
VRLGIVSCAGRQCGAGWPATAFIAAYRPKYGEIRDLARRTKAGQITVLPIR